MEIQGRQLIHDDAYRDILALSRVHSCNQTIEDKGVECPDNAFHFRVIGYQEIRRAFGVRYFQVEVVTVLVEYPVTFLGGKARGIDTQRTDHTFQLLHCLVLQSGLERTEQRCHLVVGLQHLENGLVTLIEE